MEINLETLGISKEEITQRIVDQMCEQFTGGRYLGDEFHDSGISDRLDKMVEETIGQKVKALFDENVAPRLNQYIEEISLQKTNEWGEKIGEPVTFIEYLTDQAQFYLIETVDRDGKPTKNKRDSQSRVAYLIDCYLQFSIESAMKEALKSVNSTIVDGLKKTVSKKLDEVNQQLSRK